MLRFCLLIVSASVCYDMGVADPRYLRHLLYAPPPVARWRGNLKNERRDIMMTIDELAAKLERVNVLADILLTLLVGNPQAQVLSELIIETSKL